MCGVSPELVIRFLRHAHQPGLGGLIAGGLVSCHHFAATLLLIVKLETASQALEALAGVAHLQRQAGQLEQALTLIGMVQQHPSSYQESKDRVAGLEAELRAELSAEQVTAAMARRPANKLWSAVAVVKAELNA